MFRRPSYAAMKILAKRTLWRYCGTAPQNDASETDIRRNHKPKLMQPLIHRKSSEHIDNIVALPIAREGYRRGRH